MATEAGAGTPEGAVRELPVDPPIKVAICVPCGNQVDAGFCASLAELCGLIVAQYCNQGIADLNLITFNSSYLGWSRTELAKSALEWGATHILWLDSDMVFPAWTFHHLFKQDKPVIAANYARRRPPHLPVTFKTLTPGGDEHSHALCYTEPQSEGLEEVEAVGFGVVLMQTSIFNDIKVAPFRVIDDEMCKNRVGEDVYFCLLLKEKGIPIYIDHTLSHHVTHMGTMAFSNGHSVMSREISRKELAEKKPKIELVRS